VNRVRLLPEGVAQKIAAGEVIERPVSVVKELVENSLDAGAGEIRVELEDGGKRLIRVSDDGAGMSRADASLCFRRHSTSKITTEEDLERITTLGFRGEALASVAAISRLVLRTSDGVEPEATLVEREGEKLLAIRDVAAPRGTTVEVRDLFFNLPARRKFLRSGQAELGHVAKSLTLAALAHPEVRFSLVHGKREVFSCPSVRSVRERIFQLFGKTVVDGLMDIASVDGECGLHGYASLPLAGRRDRSMQFFFVNKRPVKDRVLQAALNQAFTGILERDKSPVGFVFLTVPFGDVDVNVHPTKAEIRFRDSQRVFRLVLRAVEHALAKGLTLKDAYPEGEGAKPGPGIAEEALPLQGFAPGEMVPESRRPGDEGRPWGTGERARAPGASSEGPDGPEVLGQFANLYIVAATSREILVIDQHNAHERVLFDRYREIDRKKAWPRKMLLVPPVFDLSPSAAVRFEESADLLEEMGFRAEAMGGRSFALKEYPDIFRVEEAGDVFLSLLEEAGRAKSPDLRERFLMTLACKTAVKAGQPLNREKMGYLVGELFRTSQPALCPHGRPIVVRIEKSRIDKGMGRN
jgi:DNA mismatch repair protein MutL